MNASRNRFKTASGAPVDLEREGENGFIYQVENIDALAARLRELLTNPQRLQSMGKRSHEIISSWSYNEDVEGILKALSDEPDA
jgi:glycosyltransferase involved in cell wall biosynthesis